MRILITNDDGIHAAGLDACLEIARALSDDVWVVAPEYDQSGVSHSLSLNDPLRLREIGERRFAVKGTPTDCVIMGVRHILDGKGADLLLSGVNRGRNAAEDVTYSGTVAGAMEGAVLGIPSFALSQAYAAANRERPHWETAIQHGPDLIRRVLDTGIPRAVQRGARADRLTQSAHVDRVRAAVHRRCGTPVLSVAAIYRGPGSASHHFASLVLRCARDTSHRAMAASVLSRFSSRNGLCK